MAIVDQLAVLNERTRDQEDDLESRCELIGKYDDHQYTSPLAHLAPVHRRDFKRVLAGERVERNASLHIGTAVDLDLFG